MALQTLVFPIIIGIIAAFFLISILYQDFDTKQKFSDLGALIQLETSRPVLYPAYVSANPSVNYTSPSSNLLVSYPVYNYYPQNPLNANDFATPISKAAVQKIDNRAFVNKPDSGYNAHLSAYYGGFPYPLPFAIYPPTNIDNVKGVEDRI